jgi:hypothetical protein
VLLAALLPRVDDVGDELLPILAEGLVPLAACVEIERVPLVFAAALSGPVVEAGGKLIGGIVRQAGLDVPRELGAKDENGLAERGRPPFATRPPPWKSLPLCR